MRAKRKARRFSPRLRQRVNRSGLLRAISFAKQAGIADAPQIAQQLIASPAHERHLLLNRIWSTRWQAYVEAHAEAAHAQGVPGTAALLQAGSMYVQEALAAGAGSGLTEAEAATLHNAVWLPLARSAAAVVCVRNEAETIGTVLGELLRLPLEQIVLVINGSTDGTFSEARRFERVTIWHEPEALGHDVGRAAGVRLTKAGIVLFTDGDFPIPAEQLAVFLLAVDRGVDLALNDITPLLGSFRQWDDVSRVKLFLNTALGRPELGPNTMTSVPHALSSEALEAINPVLLAVPPKAQAAILLAGLTVECCGQVDVIGPNRTRSSNSGSGNPVARLIVGDHVEAFRYAQQQLGPRLLAPDLRRRRERAEGGGLSC